MPIEQHPIPQDVAGYKFRLIGDMTLKQFIWLAGGIILGLFIYQLPLPFFFKYPLAAIAVGLGAGIAFVPIEGRAMDKWLIAFIKSIYSPTQYVWSKQSEDPEYFKDPEYSHGTRGTKITPQPTATPAPIIPMTPITPPKPVEIPKPATPEAKPVSQPLPVVTPKPIEITPPAPAPKPVAPAGQLPIPFTPTAPNTLVGMTLTPDSKILPGCLIEIKSGGLSVRATKSNQLGQFLFAKPLENSTYQIVTEKAGYQFDTYSLNLTGQIVKPLRLQAKP